MAKHKLPKYAKAAIILIAALFALAILDYALTLNNANVVPTGADVFAPPQELGNLTSVYPNATLDTFYCSSDNDCVDVHTQNCFNNLASQQVCINKGYYDLYNVAYNKFLDRGMVACPQFFVLANASCACINQGCSLVYKTN